jgi:hypothetical protein
MLSQSEQIANLERQVRELDAHYVKALTNLARANSEISLRGREIERQAAAMLCLEARIKQLEDRNQTQSETIGRYRDELNELSHGYK